MPFVRGGRTVGRVVVVFAGLFAACAQGPEPTEVVYQINAAPDLNPDSADRASPIVVRFYELKSSGIFERSDFFALYEQEAATLGQELVARREFEIRPGESRVINETLQPETRFVGIMAAYRNIDQAKWRDVAAVVPNATTPIDVNLARLSVDMQVAGE